MAKSKTNDWAVLLRAVPIGAVFYGILVLGVNFLALALAGGVPLNNFWQKILTGLQLFLLWLVVTSTVRSIHQLARQMPVVLLWLAGGATAVLSVLVVPVVLWLARELGLPAGANWLPARQLNFYLALGLIFSLIAIIHLRVRNRALGSALEWTVIVGLGLAFFYWIK